MASSSDIQSFHSSWQQTAAWAQSKGIKYNQYYPVYQMDSQRLLSGETPMSEAERERAVQAAADPQQAFQATPSTSSNPWNIIGNTITDARNIFTGLGDIAIHPLHNGLVDSIKNTWNLLDGAHHLQGNDAQKLGQVLTGTVLSWVPGAADLGTLAQADNSIDPTKLLFDPKGLSAEAQHPISTLLDVLPVLNKAAALKVAGDAGFAERVGMLGEDAPKPSVFRVTKGYLMNTKLPGTDVGPTGLPVTIGDKIQSLTGGSILNSTPAIHDAAAGVDMTENRGTFSQQYIFTPVMEAMDNLDDEQIVKLHKLMDPAQASNLDDRIAQMEQDDPAVADAARAMNEGPRAFQTEEVLALQGTRLIEDPRSGQLGMFTQAGHAAVISAADALQTQTEEVVRSIPEMQTLAMEGEKATQVVQGLAQRLESAKQQARQVNVEGDTFPVKVHGAKNPVGFAKTHVAEEWFGTGGNIDKLLAKVNDGHFQEASAVAAAWLRRMDSWSPVSLDATSPAADPAFQAVRSQIEQIKAVINLLLENRKKAERLVYGKGKVWTGLGKYRDEMHEEAAKTLKLRQDEQTRTLSTNRKVQLNRLATAYKTLRRDIATKYADLKRFSDKQTQEITERYELEKAKATTQNLLERETFNEWRRGRTAQGFSNPRDALQAAQEGVRIAPGAPGSPEALLAAHTALELAKREELAQVTPKSLLTAQMKIEIKDSQKAEAEMTSRLTRAYDQKAIDLKDDQAEETEKLRKDNLGQRARDGEISQRFNDWTRANKDFADAVWKHPSDNNTDLYFNLLAKHIIKNEEATKALSTQLAEKHGWGEEHLQQLRSNPTVMGNLLQMALQGVEKDPIFEDLDPSIIKDMVTEAKNELAELNSQGIFPEYIPHVSAAQLSADGTGTMGIHINIGRGIPEPDALSARVWGMDTSKYDLMAGLQRGVKQILDQKAILSYVTNYLDKRVTTAAEVKDTIDTAYKDQLVGLNRESVASFYVSKLRDWNLETFDPESAFGFSLPRWGGDAVYIDKDLMRAVKKLTSDRSLPTKGIFDKTTRLFRYSILGLSPRYTAHITFGGSFLLALRSSPYALTFLGKAWKGLKTGEFDQDLFPTATNMGTTEYELSSFKQAHDAFGAAAGKQSARLLAEEHINVVQGIKTAAATPVHWLRALADLNLHFTNHVTHLQRAVAFLDGAAKAERHGITDEWGQPIEMTKERAMMEGMKHAEAVFGDLRRMSPLERQVARTIVPFYGWEKHILQYVFSFPADHPWRAMMLANMAEYDTAHSPGGLPSRYQFLFFLGTPDAQGNVSAVDLRAMNPLRDVANYATWGGFFGSLNPAISGPIAAVDPSIVYGGNELYPNLTYDQFYGIETAGPQGNLLTSAEQVVPQISAIQSALQVAGQRQGMSGTGLIKNIYNSLNIPFAQVQHINLRQEAAKTAIAQYQVTKNLAQNAWDTGNFSSIQDLGSVPDPRNADYETPVSDLQEMYNQLAEEYPGQAPSETATSLPSVHL